MALGAMGATVLLSPSAWAVRPEFDPAVTPYGQGWEESYRDIAQQTGRAVVGVSKVGPIESGAWAGWRCIGSSLAVGADGSVLGRGSYGDDAEELVVVEVPVVGDDIAAPPTASPAH